MFHRDIQTRQNNIWKHKAEGWVFLLIVFECLSFPVGHELESFKKLWLNDILSWDVCVESRVVFAFQIFNHVASRWSLFLFRDERERTKTFSRRRRERKEDILIEKSIPALTKYKTKLATEVFKEWQSSTALRDVTSNESDCEMQELRTHFEWFGCMALTNSDSRNIGLSCFFCVVLSFFKKLP